jgi:hypothetical protein
MLIQQESPTLRPFVDSLVNPGSGRPFIGNSLMGKRLMGPKHEPAVAGGELVTTLV